MFILFFLVDYIQDASWLTDGDAFTQFFFIKKKKKKTSQGREEGRAGTAVDEGTERTSTLATG